MGILQTRILLLLRVLLLLLLLPLFVLPYPPTRPPPSPVFSVIELRFSSRVARRLGFPYPLFFAKSIDCQTYLMFQTMFFSQAEESHLQAGN